MVMKMLKIVEFIKANHNWRELLSASPYNVTIKDDGGFTLLKYSQIDSDLNLELVRECRGLIIDSECNPVCVPFFKFGNYGEMYADKIDWSSAVVEEKIDGSLIKLWSHKSKWIVSTNGTIFAEKANIGSDNESELHISKSTHYSNFADLFHTARQITGLDFEKLNPDFTYMLEVVSPYNRVVVPYSDIDLFHIGTRCNRTLQEIEIDIGVKKPRTFSCNNIDDLIEMAAQLRYSEEGYVVKDKNYKRIKVKSPAYVAVHHLISGLNEKRLLELLRTNEVAEFLTYFPEYKPHVDELNAKITRLIEEIDGILQSKVDGVSYETRKDFAAMATQTRFPALL